MNRKGKNRNVIIVLHHNTVLRGNIQHAQVQNRHMKNNKECILFQPLSI